MNNTAALPSDYYSQQYNSRSKIPEHQQIFARWAQESAHVRRITSGLYDLPYGSSPGERLDFFPANRAGSPLLVFIHGGWWRSLDKSDFSFIAPPYIRAGFNVALLNYTLAPSASIAEITQQQLGALAWLYRNADRYDIDRNRIAVAGHSAGGHLAAMMLAAMWPVYGADLPADLVKAGIMLSGIYDLDPIQYVGFVNGDLKLKSEDINVLSPALMPQAHATPFITAVGGLESTEFQRQNALIGNAWKSNHVADIALPDANHFTICDEFASPDHPLFKATVDLISKID